MGATWKPVPSYPGMLASEEGEILLPPSYAPLRNGGYRIYTPKPTKGQTRRAARDASHEYRGVYVKRFGNVKVHQAVCEAFHGPRPTPVHVVLHLDENGHNNRADNLRWGTRKENQNAPGFKAWAASVCQQKMRGEAGMRKESRP